MNQSVDRELFQELEINLFFLQTIFQVYCAIEPLLPAS